MSSILKLLRRKKKEDVGIIVGTSEAVRGELPDPRFVDLIEYYRRDPVVRAAIDDLAERAVGMGFYTTAEDDGAKKIIDNFNEEVNLDGLNMECAKHCFGYGNWFLERVFDEVVDLKAQGYLKYKGPKEGAKIIGLKPLPISSFVRVWRSKFGKVWAFEQRIATEHQFLSPLICQHFRWNPIDSEPFGLGLIQTLALPGKGFTRTDKSGTQEKIQRPAFLAMKEEHEVLLRDFLRRYVGRYAFVWDKVPDDSVKTWMSEISKLKENQDIGIGTGVDGKCTIVPMSIDPRARFDSIIGHMDSQTIIGLQTPAMRLFTTPGFTEASAKEAVDISDRKVAAFQRFLKRIIEREIFQPLLVQNGLNPVQANVRLNWGTQEMPEVDVNHIIELARISATTGVPYMTREEIRKNLVKIGIELEQTSEKEQEET